MKRRSIDLRGLPSNRDTDNRRPVSEELSPIVPPGSIKAGRRRGKVASAVQTIGNELFKEVLVPALRNMTWDFFTSGIERAIYGDTERYGRGRYGAPRPYDKPYRGQSRVVRGRSRPQRSVNRYISHEPDEPVFEDAFFYDRVTAERVLGKMIELVDTYNVATVGNFDSLIGRTSSISAELWGWDDLRGVRVVPSSEGYVIRFPEIVPID